MPENKEAQPDDKGLREIDLLKLALSEQMADQRERDKQRHAEWYQQQLLHDMHAVQLRDDAARNAVSAAVNPAVTAAVRGATAQAAQQVRAATQPPSVDDSPSSIKPF